MSKKTRSFLVIVGVVSIIFAALTLYVYTAKPPFARKIKHQIEDFFAQTPEDPIETLHDTKEEVLYEDNVKIAKKEIDPNKDNKLISYTDSIQRLTNYPDGYSIDLPLGFDFNFDYSPLYVKAQNDGAEIVISRETSPYDDVDEYINFYLNRFILNENYRTSNKLTLIEEKKEGNLWLITVRLENMLVDRSDMFTFATLKTDTRVFYRLLFKYKSTQTDFYQTINTTLSNIKSFEPVGTFKYSNIDFKPGIPSNWSRETLDLYNKISKSSDIMWGLFTKDIYTTGIDKTVPEMEKTIDYKFPVILSYVHWGTDFPVEFMQKNYNEGKIVELTYQFTTSNNEKLFDHTPNIDIYKGGLVEEMRKLARQVKSFGHPFLFRLNNEMNSDWTSYSGVINLSDPDLYISNWRTLYRIFEEEGVNNAIWVFNPNDRNYPPCRWNNFLAYYPGDEYVQMIGVTGYNTGTYYDDYFGETWREFKEIYDHIQETYDPFFLKFPWIITEFASSSVGGDKVKWIDNMFDVIQDYPNIKIAVWFDYADYDVRPENKGKESRPYWLQKPPEVLDAFKRGIHRNN